MGGVDPEPLIGKAKKFVLESYEEERKKVCEICEAKLDIFGLSGGRLRSRNARVARVTARVARVTVYLFI